MNECSTEHSSTGQGFPGFLTQHRFLRVIPLGLLKKAEDPDAVALLPLIGLDADLQEKAKVLPAPIGLCYKTAQLARYEIYNTAAIRSSAPNIVDLPSGYSPRGFRVSSAGKRYFGFDLPVVIDDTVTMKVNMAVEEAVVNVMKYAYPIEYRGDVTIEAASNNERLKFTIIDSGKPFDPTVQAEVDTTLSAKERKIGGLGIHIMRQNMDSMNYERIDNLNVLTLRKNIKH